MENIVINNIRVGETLKIGLFRKYLRDEHGFDSKKSDDVKKAQIIETWELLHPVFSTPAPPQYPSCKVEFSQSKIFSQWVYFN